MEVNLANPERIDHQISNQEVENFSTDVNEFAEIERLIQETKAQIEPLQKRLKELKEDKKHIEQGICQFMGENNVAECNLPENTGKLKYDTKKTLEPVTQQQVKDGILKFFTDEPALIQKFNVLPSEDKANSLIDYIYKTQRKVIEKTSLRKITPRVKVPNTKK